MSAGEPPDAVELDPAGEGRSDASAEELAVRLAALEAENRRLRQEYARAHRVRYRRTAIALVAVGIVAAVAALLFPDARPVLLALSGTGVFAGLLTYYLAPETVIAAPVAGAVYRAVGGIGTALAAELGLADARVYVPTDGTAGDPDTPARLFVPQHAEYELPDPAALDSLFVVTEAEGTRGVSLPPTGGWLYREFERALPGAPSDDPAVLAGQLADGLVEDLELARAATPELDADGGRLVAWIDDAAFGAPGSFDHPVASFLAVGLAVGLSRPVVVEVAPDGDDRYDTVLAFDWSEDE